MSASLSAPASATCGADANGADISAALPAGDALLAALPAAVLLLDARGRIAFANPAARAWLGNPLIGLAWREVCARDFSTTADGGDLRAGDGRLINLSTRPLRPGQPAGHCAGHCAGGQIVLLADVSETRAMQRLAERNLRLAGMGEMLARLSHQVRTPLSAAILYASQLAGDALDSAQRQRATERVLARLRHMEQMVRDMLMFAHGAQFRLERLSPAALLDDVRAQLEPHLSAAGARLDCHCGADLQLDGNRVGLLAALQNLCLNAVENGATRLSISAAREPGGGLCLCVADDGPGIPAELRERILQPFFTTRSDGTGLGLPVVRSVVESHRGCLSIEDNPGGGALFRLRFPAPEAVAGERKPSEENR